MQAKEGIRSAFLHDAQLTQTELFDTTLEGADLTEAGLEGSKFVRCSFSNAKTDWASMRAQVTFQSCLGMAE